MVQIKKINNNKLKVILNSKDLYDKNIDIDSFLSNSIESQNLFFEILDLAEEKYNFDIENNKAVVETISLDNNIFILTITKLKNDFISTSSTPCKIYCFENIDTVLYVFTLLKENNLILKNTYIYKFLDNYYLFLDNCTKNMENFITEYASPINDINIKNILIEHGERIK